jgi:hypothetical protein
MDPGAHHRHILLEAAVMATDGLDPRGSGRAPIVAQADEIAASPLSSGNDNRENSAAPSQVICNIFNGQPAQQRIKLEARVDCGGARPLKFTKLGPVFAALVLAACQSAPPPSSPMAMVPPAVAGPARGIDIPTDASDILGELKGSRLDFVARYYRDPASRWPSLSSGEVQRLSSLGLKIVTVWESHSRRPDYFSYASGYYDALSAYRQAKAVAQPPDSAIYFAVDFNARGYDLYPVDQYFRGVHAGFAAAGNGTPDYKIGVYGSGAVCTMIKGERLAQYSWLSGSTAWEGSSGYTGWNIRQADQGARWAHLSFVHDANEATEDYGGFRLAGDDAVAVAVATAPPNPTDVAQQAPEPDHSLVGMIRSWF